MKAPDTSPLPWSTEESDGYLLILDADGEILAEPDYRGDARLIVTAVNSHADLLAAAKEALNAWTENSEMGTIYDMDRAASSLHAAIAKSENHAP